MLEAFEVSLPVEESTVHGTIIFLQRAGLRYTIKFLDPVAKTWDMRNFGADEVKPRSGRDE